MPAFHFHGRDYTYAEWDAYADRFARALLAAGLRKGDRLVLLLPPIPEYLFCYLGAARDRRDHGRHQHALPASGDRRDPRQRRSAAGADGRRAPRTRSSSPLIDAVRAAAPSLERVVRFEGDGAGHARRAACGRRGGRASTSPRPRPPCGRDDPIAIVYTSGTTGTPKGAVYDSAAMIALTRMFSSRLPAPPPPGEPNLWPGMSLTHVGAMVRVHIQLAFASTMVLHDRFDARWCLEQLQRLRPARLGGFPPVLVMLMRDPEFARHDWSFVKAVTFGGAPLAQHLVEEIERQARRRRLHRLLVHRDGDHQRHAGHRSARAPPGDGRPADRRASSCASSTSSASRCRPATPGRIAVRSPATMRGYWRRPEETARALDAAGWLYTEDMGFLDEHGYLHLIGREKDMYFRAAFNVYPGEVEAALQSHPKVAQAAVLGVPDDVLGHKGWAFVVPTDPGDPPTLAELRAHVGAELASYKRPDGLTIVDALPTNAMYKVDKRALRAQWEP